MITNIQALKGFSLWTFDRDGKSYVYVADEHTNKTEVVDRGKDHNGDYVYSDMELYAINQYLPLNPSNPKVGIEKFWKLLMLETE